MKEMKEKKDMMSPAHEAKRRVLQDLSDSMRRHMGEGMKSHMGEPMKKVEVEAPDAEGIRKGLDLASELAPHMDEMAKNAGDIMGDEEEPRDMDEAAMDYEEEEHEMPEDHAALVATHRNQDAMNESEMEKLRKALSKKA